MNASLFDMGSLLLRVCLFVFIICWGFDANRVLEARGEHIGTLDLVFYSPHFFDIELWYYWLCCLCLAEVPP